MPVPDQRQDNRLNQIVKVAEIPSRADRYSVREVLDSRRLGDLVRSWYAVPTVPTGTAEQEVLIHDWLLFIYQFGGGNRFALDGFFPNGQPLRILDQECRVTGIFDTVWEFRNLTSSDTPRGPRYDVRTRVTPSGLIYRIFDCMDISYRVGSNSRFADAPTNEMPFDLPETYQLSPRLSDDAQRLHFFKARPGLVHDYEIDPDGDEFIDVVRTEARAPIPMAVRCIVNPSIRIPANEPDDQVNVEVIGVEGPGQSLGIKGPIFEAEISGGLGVAGLPPDVTGVDTWCQFLESETAPANVTEGDVFDESIFVERIALITRKPLTHGSVIIYNGEAYGVREVAESRRGRFYQILATRQFRSLAL